MTSNIIFQYGTGTCIHHTTYSYEFLEKGSQQNGAQAVRRLNCLRNNRLKIVHNESSGDSDNNNNNSNEGNTFDHALHTNHDKEN